MVVVPDLQINSLFASQGPEDFPTPAIDLKRFQVRLCDIVADPNLFGDLCLNTE